jgi:hypothetical protein
MGSAGSSGHWRKPSKGQNLDCRKNGPLQMQVVVKGERNPIGLQKENQDITLNTQSIKQFGIWNKTMVAN